MLIANWAFFLFYSSYDKKPSNNHYLQSYPKHNDTFKEKFHLKKNA
ncbi:hypothetical protein FEM08_09770 [Flavobacterium gilvum]|nr:hypothetical protein FEM08_09770 [Flavobacterium gilvum]